jgi:DNA-binding NarL/FixJ family response regulator
VVGRICRRLDGIPLAVELAAARLRVMPAAELDARLDERFVLLTGGSRAALPRQQTLRALVDWSWELLTGAERAVLARLSVFAGGFGLAAAEAVAAGGDVPAAEVAGQLGALVDKSLVQFDDTAAGRGRYRLLETVRQYAAGQLAAYGPAAAGAARAAHRDYYLALAEAAAPQLMAADQATWLDRLDTDLANLRAAITYSLTQTDPEPGLRLAASLREFWQARGHAAEFAVGRALDLVVVAHEALQEIQAERAAQRADALVSEPDARSAEAASVLTPREFDVLKLVAQGFEQLGHRPAAGAQRAHGPPAPGQHPPQTQPLLARRCHGLGRAHRTGVSPARSGHQRRPRETGPYRRGDGAASGRQLVPAQARRGQPASRRRRGHHVHPYQCQHTPAPPDDEAALVAA